MRTRLHIMNSSKLSAIACAVINCAFLIVASQGAPEPKQDASAASQPKQKQFDTAKQAADALIQVATNLDVAAAKEILGPDGEDLVNSEDPVMDKKRAEEFASKAKEKMSVETGKKSPNEAILIVGNDSLPL